MSIQPFRYDKTKRSPSVKRNRDFIYKFRQAREDEPVPNSRLNYRTEKWIRGPHEGAQDDQEPRLVNTYHLWGDDEDSLLCDCPGATYHLDKEGLTMHKHTIWLREYIELTTLGGQPENIYYDPITERFNKPLP